ncbi:8095_t:CDS:2 [Racocetra fulgida]|uniref:8095_t:CDS:1 n=1 Tax=Racocetra fulgida TaxID=60492 RepID=A0A9N9GVA2_9GLOM|nr:8095_t:CDS:2 [Racocetra fulgida]
MEINKEYLRENRREIEELDVVHKEIEGVLDLSDFINLEKLDCSHNEFTNLNIKELIRLNIVENGTLPPIEEEIKIFAPFSNLKEIGINQVSFILQKYAEAEEKIKNLERNQKIGLVIGVIAILVVGISSYFLGKSQQKKK